MKDLIDNLLGSKSPNPLDFEFNKGDNHENISKIKHIINSIAKLKGLNQLVLNNQKINLPIEVDNHFDDDSYKIANEFFPSFKTTGKITLRSARKRWAYSSGYFSNAFPSQMVDVSNYNELLVSYLNGIKDYNRFKSDQVAESMLQLFEYLGASRIKIVNNTEKTIGSNLDVQGIEASAKGSSTNEVLRERKFGKSPIKTEMALQLIEKMKSMPKVITAANSRIDSNLLSEVFTENVKLSATASLTFSAGLEAAGIPSGSLSAEYSSSKFWQIEVDFYDKSEL
jgi:hypothetical protein